MKLSIETLAYLTKRIKISAIKQGIKFDELEDCTQELLTRIFEGRHRKSTIDQAIVDYIRHKEGDRRALSHDKRKNFTENIKLNQDAYLKLYDANKLGVIDNNKIIFSQLYKLLDSKENKVVFKMHYQWGFSELEIADFFDITEGAISRRLSKIKDELRSVL